MSAVELDELPGAIALLATLLGIAMPDAADDSLAMKSGERTANAPAAATLTGKDLTMNAAERSLHESRTEGER